MTTRRTLLTVIACVVLTLSVAPRRAAADRRKAVIEDRERFLEDERWIYDDVERAFAEAKKTGKPILAVIRCLPCESCNAFDESVAAHDPKVRLLMNRFVRLRIPKGNSLDLTLFQFDFDLSFFAFFLNADGSIYGRFGSPSTQLDHEGAVSLDAFKEALAAALALHKRFPEIRGSLEGKRAERVPYRVPEDYPPLRGRYSSKLDYEGKVVQSCIHCHQIRDSERQMYRQAGEIIPDPVLHPYPLPDVFGLHLDPSKRATVRRVDDGSVAAKAGFKAGDELVSLEGQPLVSIADIQWVLHNALDIGSLQAVVKRKDGGEATLAIPLTPEWRKSSEIDWRVTTWDLRRMATGGLLLEDLPDEERTERGFAKDTLALRVKHVGQYGQHATAKKAGFKKGDLIVELDGSRERLTETGFIAHALQRKKPGERIEMAVLRDGEERRLGFGVK